MRYRYLGSKQRLAKEIAKFIGAPSQEGKVFVDAFCGTGSIAEVAFDYGWNVRLNDNMYCAVIMAFGRLICYEQINFKKLGGYKKVIEKLNSLEPSHGFIWRTYSPASYDSCGIERRYFTEYNAGRIDSIRSLIKNWSESGFLNETEKFLLIADLLSALNSVANIAGTYGCFLSKWTKQSQGILELKCRQLKTRSTKIEFSVGDVFDVFNTYQDLVYLDPPYTKRQYASYYHLLETVALGDEPLVEGVAGLRPWKDRASDFCYKTRALKTLFVLVQSLKAQKILLSYSSEGHIKMEDMITELSKIGSTTFYPLGSIGRYRPNKVAGLAASNVKEFLVVVEKSVVQHSPFFKKSFEDIGSIGVEKDEYPPHF